MKPVNDQQAVLELLKREGQISDEEYQRLVGDREQPSTTSDRPVDDDAPDPDAGGVEGRPAEALSLLPLRDDITINHAGSVAVAAIGLIVFSSLGMVSWLFTLAAFAVMAITFFRGGQKIAIVAGAALAVLTFLGFAASAEEDPGPVGTIPATTPVAAEPEVPGSLRINMDEVTEAWNTVADGPRISKGLTRYNETGEYDTFIYRFGEWGRLAGAFDPDDETVYALVTSGWLSQEATERFYLHLCFMVAPYSQECVDAYLTEGLGDKPLAEYTDASHESEWTFGEDTWRLEIEQNVLTIRVFGADAA